MNTAKLKLLVGGALIAGGIAYMAYLSAEQTGQYAIGVTDYTTAPAKWTGRGLRVGGLAQKGSWHAQGTHHTFAILDDHDLTSTLPVVFDGTMPDTFAEELKVIVAGKMDGPALRATEVIPQCKSKYEGVDPSMKNYVPGETKKPNRPGFGGPTAAVEKPEAVTR